MEQKIDKNGKRVPVSVFSDLKVKLETCEGYCSMYNHMAADKNMPQIDMEYAMNKIRKQHSRFYNEDNRYMGDGSLRK